MRTCCALFTLSALLACGGSEGGASSEELGVASPDQMAAPALSGAAESVRAASSASSAKPAGDPPHAVRPSELAFTLPDGWVEETPAVPMRKLQARVPRVGDDAHDAELSVLWRGAVGMGPLEAQLTRWSQQFTQTDGASSRERLKLTNRTLGGRAVTEAELEGTCVAERVPGASERWNEPDWKLLGAVIESEFGPYYVRLVGPRATVDAAASGFRALLESTAR
ncbi:MAG: hypothetical protein FJ298_08780 [Planctomycetes bacterium]|nr:hypothetical protein [Planctomycetota bacterium]